MEKLVLKVKVRDKVGKGYARKLRREGYLPAILYGPHLKKNLSLEVNTKDLRSLIHRYSVQFA